MASQSPAPDPGSSVLIRRATAADAQECGKICFDAFLSIAKQHNFPPDFPTPEVPIAVLTMVFSNPAFFCVVAEQDGKIIGSNCLDERSIIAGVGPITIDPAAQNKTAGRQLMMAVMNRAQEKKFAGVRLVQVAYHNRSLSLYAKLGFDAREPLSCMQGTPLRRSTPGCEIRAARSGDLEACNALCLRVHGHDRSRELTNSIEDGAAVVAVSRSRITAYSTSLAFFGHSVAESNADLQALIAAAPEFGGPGILVPTRNAGLFRWCLENGLRVTQPMTLMSVGLYNEPAGAYLPSILF